MKFQRSSNGSIVMDVTVCPSVRPMHQAGEYELFEKGLRSHPLPPFLLASEPDLFQPLFPGAPITKRQSFPDFGELVAVDTTGSVRICEGPVAQYNCIHEVEARRRKGDYGCHGKGTLAN